MRAYFDGATEDVSMVLALLAAGAIITFALLQLHAKLDRIRMSLMVPDNSQVVSEMGELRQEFTNGTDRVLNEVSLLRQAFNELNANKVSHAGYHESTPWTHGQIVYPDSTSELLSRHEQSDVERLLRLSVIKERELIYFNIRNEIESRIAKLIDGVDQNYNHLIYTTSVLEDLHFSLSRKITMDDCGEVAIKNNELRLWHLEIIGVDIAEIFMPSHCLILHHQRLGPLKVVSIRKDVRDKTNLTFVTKRYDINSDEKVTNEEDFTFKPKSLFEGLFTHVTVGSDFASIYAEKFREVINEKMGPPQLLLSVLDDKKLYRHFGKEMPDFNEERIWASHLQAHQYDHCHTRVWADEVYERAFRNELNRGLGTVFFHDDGYDPNDRFPDDGYIPDEDTYNNYQGDRDESTYRWDFEKK